MTGQNGLSSSFVETVAGFTAGVVSTLCLHPLDLVKTRLQGMIITLSHLGIVAWPLTSGQLIGHRHLGLVVPCGLSVTFSSMKAAALRFTGVWAPT